MGCQYLLPQNQGQVLITTNVVASIQVKDLQIHGGLMYDLYKHTVLNLCGSRDNSNCISTCSRKYGLYFNI